MLRALLASLPCPWGKSHPWQERGFWGSCGPGRVGVRLAVPLHLLPQRLCCSAPQLTTHCPAPPYREGIRVAAGSNYLGRNNVTRWVRKIHLHPLYNPKTYDNDLALLLLHKPIPHSWFHTALCLPDHTVVPDDNMWDSCFVAGWGLTKAGEPEAPQQGPRHFAHTPPAVSQGALLHPAKPFPF